MWHFLTCNQCLAQKLTAPLVQTMQYDLNVQYDKQHKILIFSGLTREKSHEKI